MSQTIKTTDIEFHLLKAVQEAIQVGLLIVDSDSGRIVYANNKLCEMFEYSSRELMSMTFPRLLCEGEDPDVWKQKTDSNVIKFRNRSGNVIWGLMSSRWIYDEKQRDLGIFCSISDITPRKIAENQLKISQKKLKQLAKKLIDAQEAERKRISVELHDGIGSNITAVRLMLERKIAETGHADPELESLVDMLKTISTDTRRISRNLHPSILEDIGLNAAFTSVIREFEKLAPEIEIRHRISVNEHKMAGSAKLTLYRILQEALNNIIKHSGADTVDVVCEFTEGYLQLEISDNGCGFDAVKAMDNGDDEMSGLGLESMKERTDYCQGTFTIGSEIGRGTRLNVRIPA